MKAIRVLDHKPTLVDLPLAEGDGVLVRVEASSICGSDLHMIKHGFSEGRVPGHEFAGTTPDGTAVAVEPLLTCGRCRTCLQGYHSHCESGQEIIGVMLDGGMAEYIRVPDYTLVPLPSGLETRTASLVEPLAIAVNGLNRARMQERERVLVIGAGPIGLAVAAVLHARGIRADIAARHPHQQAAAERLGMSISVGDGYDLVIDAVGTQGSIRQAVGALRAMGRIAMLGSPWEGLSLEMGLCMKEIELIPAAMYRSGGEGGRDFVEAAQILADNPVIADLMITHRFPLEGVSEAFGAAGDRASGAIKVVFEPAL